MDNNLFTLSESNMSRSVSEDVLNDYVDRTEDKGSNAEPLECILPAVSLIQSPADKASKRCTNSFKNGSNQTLKVCL